MDLTFRTMQSAKQCRILTSSIQDTMNVCSQDTMKYSLIFLQNECKILYSNMKCDHTLMMGTCTKLKEVNTQ